MRFLFFGFVSAFYDRGAGLNLDSERRRSRPEPRDPSTNGYVFNSTVPFLSAARRGRVVLGFFHGRGACPHGFPRRRNAR